MSEHTVPGWPATEGPLRSLREAGLLPPAGVPLPWSTGSTAHVAGGEIIYRANCSRLTNPAVRLLAALTFEGWLVTVAPSGERLKISVRATPDPDERTAA